MSPRKRARRDAPLSVDGEVQAGLPVVPPLPDPPHEPPVEHNDGLKDEYYEAADQLSLSFHRLFALIRELDTQAQGYESELQPAIRAYIAGRLKGTLLARSDTRTGRESEPQNSAARNESSTSEDCKGIVNDVSLHADMSNSERLSRISWLMAEIVQASEEKESLALAAWNSVERHIRLLDQAIREQEIELNIAPTVAPPALLEPPQQLETVVAPITALAQARASENKRSRRGRKQRRQSTATQLMDGGTGAEHAEGWRLADAVPQDGVGAGPVGLLGTDAAIDPREPRYCYCNQISYGEMIACDNKQCRMEWFHLACVGLKAVPRSVKWYCPDCEKLNRG